MSLKYNNNNNNNNSHNFIQAQWLTFQILFTVLYLQSYIYRVIFTVTAVCQHFLLQKIKI